MALDLKRVMKETGVSGPPADYPAPLAAAVVSDCFRLAKVTPPTAKEWHEWSRTASPRGKEQLSFLAHLLTATSLRDETIRALAVPRPDQPLASFFEAIEPLTGELLGMNTFRKEEFVRRWIAWVGGEIAGESQTASRRNVERLDYRKILAEFERAEKTRRAEADRRARLLVEAAKREADARGWRE
jgi:hypothetical protein